MQLLDLCDDIFSKILIELKYQKKQEYYDKCKKWLIKDISNLEDIGYYIEVKKSFKCLFGHGHMYKTDQTIDNKNVLHEEFYELVLIGAHDIDRPYKYPEIRCSIYGCMACHDIDDIGIYDGYNQIPLPPGNYGSGFWCLEYFKKG